MWSGPICKIRRHIRSSDAVSRGGLRAGTLAEGRRLEAIVRAWDRDEPEQAGVLRAEQIEFETSAN
jgi:hypothetical protein